MVIGGAVADGIVDCITAAKKNRLAEKTRIRSNALAEIGSSAGTNNNMDNLDPTSLFDSR